MSSPELKTSMSAIAVNSRETTSSSFKIADSPLSTFRTTAGASSPFCDLLFEPSVEMMVNDFDDERTLEEEEALAAAEAEDPSTELSNLQRERDMPIEELLALYNCRGNEDGQNDEYNDEYEEEAEYDKSFHIRSSRSSRSSINEHESEERISFDKDEEESDLKKLYTETFKPVGTDKHRHLRTLSRLHSEEEDVDYSPEEDEDKKTIMVGSEFQAVIPESLCKYGDALPYENEDKLVWDPSKLQEQDVENYQRKSICLLTSIQQPQTETITTVTSCKSTLSNNVSAIPIGNHLRDCEQVLYLLLQCGHNIDEALRRRRIHINAASTSSTDTPSNEMSQWSEEECRHFENGLRVYGKNFHAIQQSKVKTRSVGELVQFYYLWKKTERHDVFANKARLEKKKYSLHPGLTDYMDRFLEEQEVNGIIVSSSSCGGSSGLSGCVYNVSIHDRSSPGINSILYKSYQRQRSDSRNSDKFSQHIVDSLNARKNKLSPSHS